MPNTNTSTFCFRNVFNYVSFYCYVRLPFPLFSLIFQGMLKGFDQTINLILDESHERVYSSGQGVEQVILGLYIVRGDNV